MTVSAYGRCYNPDLTGFLQFGTVICGFGVAFGDDMMLLHNEFCMKILSIIVFV